MQLSIAVKFAAGGRAVMMLAVGVYIQLYHFMEATLLLSVKDEIIPKAFKNISDGRLMVKPSTFVNDHGLRRNGDVKGILRMPPKYYLPSERTLNVKLLDMMRQAVYDTQDNMRALEPILEKYKDDPALRMAFIFERLKQLIIDIRRLYTLALKWRSKKRVTEQILWYTYCVRKFIDVLYIVEHVIDSHTEYMKILDRG